MTLRTWIGLALLAVSGPLWASEPSSVYLRCTMTAEQYAKAMAAPPGSALAYSDWQAWFDSQGPSGLGPVELEWLRDYSAAPSLQALVQLWLGAGGTSRYDPQTGSWQFALLEFTDNYGEMIQLLAPLRGVASYCQPQSGSFLFIYSYFWGNGDNAYLTLDNQRSQFAPGPTPAQRSEADAALKVLMESSADRN